MALESLKAEGTGCGSDPGQTPEEADLSQRPSELLKVPRGTHKKGSLVPPSWEE